METKQGATADLLQQKPHVEVADSKASAVSSDERDWLKASQRLDCKPKEPLEHSGERSLGKERWSRGPGRQRPPGKTPSRVKGTAGGSGSVKRPHKD
jgi:hypothetical protein